MLRTIIVAVLSLLAATPAATAPVGEDDRDDLRCVIVVGIAGSQPAANTSAEMKTGIASGIAFFMGRIKGRNPTADLTSMLVTEAKGLAQNPAELQREFVRCGGEMKAFGAEAKAAGAALQSTAPNVDLST